jgi:hypothetical protein
VRAEGVQEEGALRVSQVDPAEGPVNDL